MPLARAGRRAGHHGGVGDADRRLVPDAGVMDHRRLHDRAGLAAGDLRLPSPLDRGGRGLAAAALHRSDDWVQTTQLVRLALEIRWTNRYLVMEDRDGRKLRVHLDELRSDRRCSRRSCPRFVMPAPPASPSTRHRDGARPSLSSGGSSAAARHLAAVRSPQPRPLVRGLPGPVAFRHLTPWRPGRHPPQHPASTCR
jgi:hypothetical protein